MRCLRAWAQFCKNSDVLTFKNGLKTSFGAKEFISEPKSVMFACMDSMLKEL